jgi:hypothetical protein
MEQLINKTISTIMMTYHKYLPYINNNDIEFLDSQLFDFDVFVEAKIELLSNKIFCYEFFERNLTLFKFCKLLNESNIETLLMNRSIFNCLSTRNTCDIENVIYVKNLTYDVIMNIHKIIESLFDFKIKIIMARTYKFLYWIISIDDESPIHIFKLALVSIKSWLEIFIMMPGHYLCYGFDVKTNKLICFKERLNFFVNMKENIFIDLFFNDDVEYLKYHKIYNTIQIKIYLINDTIVEFDNNKLKTLINDIVTCQSINLVDYMIKFCKLLKNVYCTNNIHDLIKKEYVYPTIRDDLQKTKTLKIKYEITEKCEIIDKTRNVFAHSNSCSHYVSLDWIINNNINKCPICDKQNVIFNKIIFANPQKDNSGIFKTCDCYICYLINNDEFIRLKHLIPKKYKSDKESIIELLKLFKKTSFYKNFKNKNLIKSCVMLDIISAMKENAEISQDGKILYSNKKSISYENSFNHGAKNIVDDKYRFLLRSHEFYIKNFNKMKGPIFHRLMIQFDEVLKNKKNITDINKMKKLIDDYVNDFIIKEMHLY